MSAERIPPVSLAARALSFTVRLALRAPRAVLVTAIVLAIAAGTLAATRLEMKTSRLDLLNPHSEFNQRWLAYLDEFGEDDDAVLVVEGPRREDVVAALNALGEQLEAHSDQFSSIVFRVDVEQLKQKALYFLEPSQLRQAEHFVAEMRPVAQNGFRDLNAAHILLGAIQQVQLAQQAPSATPAITAEAERRAAEVVESLHVALESPGVVRYPAGGLTVQPASVVSSTGHLLASDGRLGFILVAVARGEHQSKGSAEQIGLLRQVIADVRPQHPHVEIGLTGLPILEHDEMQTSQHDMSRATLYSLLGVALLFTVGFGQLRLPLLAVTNLLLGIAWCFGFITLSVGHLNLLSVSFGAILVGLGIDFGIHVVARYLSLRDNEVDSAAALARSIGQIGPGMTTGAVTTAVAFLAAAMSDFTGIAELGLIAGGGVLLCLIGSLVVLPVMILLSERRRPAADAALPLPVSALCRPATQTPRFTIVLGLLITAALATGLPHLRFDHNLLHLQADNLESVAWEKRLLSRGDQSVWFAVSMCDSSAELIQRKRAFEQLPTVARVEEIASLTAELPEKQERIRQLASTLATLPNQFDPSLVPASTEPQHVRQAIAMGLSVAGHPATPLLSQALRRLDELIAQLPPDEIARRLGQYQVEFARQTFERLAMLRRLAMAEPPNWDDVPQAWRARFLGAHGRHALRIFASGDIWDMDRLQAFVSDLERVDPRVTGHPVQTFYASRQMQRSYIHAAIYAAFAVMIILMLDFKSVRYTGLALVPLTLGCTQTLGLMGLLDIPLNAANMIVLPLLIGIGIDNGVHVIHDFLRRGGTYTLGSATATAIALTSATTMVGFGSMMVAHHQGLRSLGQVLTLGVFCCLVMSLIFLPAVLTVLDGRLPQRRAVRASRTVAPNAFSAHDVAGTL